LQARDDERQYKQGLREKRHGKKDPHESSLRAAG
jgi:hypothetical protein